MTMRWKVARACVLALVCCSLWAQTPGPIEVGTGIKTPFKFVAFGDTRFTNPDNHAAANDEVRQAIVKAIADEHPAFISIGGDLVYNGFDTNDWKIYDEETEAWRKAKIPIYPALGNHDLHGKLEDALGNYFARFPDLQRSRYYSVRTATTLMLVLDSSEDETRGKQGLWLKQKLDTMTPEIEFVFVVLHHPPITHSSEREILRGGGHSARGEERQLAKFLEARQAKMAAKIIVIAGHVHNYERFEHGGITYLVTGGGGAHPYYIPRAKDDPLHGLDVNYHYLLVEVKAGEVKITMKRVEMVEGKAKWTKPDEVTVNSGR